MFYYLIWKCIVQTVDSEIYFDEDGYFQFLEFQDSLRMDNSKCNWHRDKDIIRFFRAKFQVSYT